MNEYSIVEQLKLFAFLIPFVLLCLACNKLNLSQRYRGRQVLMPILTFLLSLYAVFKIQQISDELYSYLESLLNVPNQVLPAGGNAGDLVGNLKDSDLAHSVGNALGTEADPNALKEAVSNVVHDDAVSKFIRKILQEVRDFFGESFSLELLFSYFINFACALAFLAIKGILLPILKAIWSNRELMDLTVTRFYRRIEIPEDYYDKLANGGKTADGKAIKKSLWRRFIDFILRKKETPKTESQPEKKIDGWFVLPQIPSYRKLLMGTYVGVFVATVLIFLASVFHPEWPIFKASFYPVFILLIFGEVVAFLDGLEYQKVEEKPKVVEKKRESTDPQYRKIWEDLRKKFGEYMMGRSPSILPKTISDPPTIDKSLDFLKLSEDEDIQNLGEYFEKFGDEIDPSYVEGCIRLLKGKSTIFCNPFYEDLSRYLFPPIIYQLLSYNKCLFIMGRDAVAEDFCQWLRKGILDFLGAEGLWYTEILSEAPNNFDLGILKFSDIYNLALLNTHKEFFSQVRFVFIVEPSKILATGQLALSLIVSHLDLEHCDEITYCACDHNCDGLVDNLSHALKTSMTDVIASLPGNGFNMQIFWDADSQNMQHKLMPNVTHYLGIGTEISIVGIRHGVRNESVPGNTLVHQNQCWFACDKFPIKDMMWIAGQYYRQICEAAKLDIGQEQFNRALSIRSNIWHCPKAEKSFLILEDEYNNVFEISRVFSSRSLHQGFLNIISSHYLLRDFMIEYIDLFQQDAKAIPTIVPDYARTERNVILKLLMMMSAEPLPEDYIRHELMLGNFIDKPEPEKAQDSNDAKRRASIDLRSKFFALIKKHIIHTDLGECIHYRSHEKLLDDGFTVHMEYQYEISEGNHDIRKYLQNLKNAYFICEDEQSEKHFISAKLYGHVFQCYLPGQFITLDGKYYQVVSISDNEGIVLRRAADHIHKRLYYRQHRTITLTNSVRDESMGVCRDIKLSSGLNLGIERIFADFAVDTNGVLECSPYHDIKHARYYRFRKDEIQNGDRMQCEDETQLRSNDLSESGNESKKENNAPRVEIPQRNYHHKNALRIRLPRIDKNSKVIGFKRREIKKLTEIEFNRVKQECEAIDAKVQAAIKEAKRKVDDENLLAQLREQAREQGEQCKKEFWEKTKADRAPCLKLRDSLLMRDKAVVNQEIPEFRIGDGVIPDNESPNAKPTDTQNDEAQGQGNAGASVEAAPNAKPTEVQSVDAQGQESTGACIESCSFDAFTEQEEVEAEREEAAKHILDVEFGKFANEDTFDRVRFTICLLLNEIFKTTYPDAWQYIDIVTDYESQGNLKPALYRFVDNTKGKEANKTQETVASEEPHDSDGNTRDAGASEGTVPSVDGADATENAFESENGSNTTVGKSEKVSFDKEDLKEDVLRMSERTDVFDTESILDAEAETTESSEAQDTASSAELLDSRLASSTPWLFAGAKSESPEAQGTASNAESADGDHDASADAQTPENTASVPDSQTLDRVHFDTGESKVPDFPKVQDTAASAETADGEHGNADVAQMAENSASEPDLQTPDRVNEERDGAAPANKAAELDAQNAAGEQVSGAQSDISKEDDHDHYIYIFEDSEIDLGLTVSIERYLDKYLEIVYEILVWHTEQMAKCLAQKAEAPETDAEIVLVIPETKEEDTEVTAPKGWFARLIAYIKRLFGNGDAEKKTKSAAEKQPQEPTSDEATEEDKELQSHLRHYIDQCFLKYGDTDFDPSLAIKETIAYLGLLGYDDNRFSRARNAYDVERSKKDESPKKGQVTDNSGKETTTEKRSDAKS